MVYRIYVIVVLLVSCTFLSQHVYADDAKPIEVKMSSKVLGEERKILIQLPRSYQQNKERKYPVIYQIDGPRLIEQAKQTLEVSVRNNLAPEVIIVGIANTSRSRDLVPYVDKGRDFPQGGSDKFLDFFEKELIPYVDQNYRTQPFKILSGHSFGGLFTVYALYTRPDLFQAHFAFSPSLQWANKRVAKEAARYFKKAKFSNLFLYANIGNEGGEMQQGFDLVKQAVKENASKTFKHKFNNFPEESHMTVTFMGQYLAFKELYKDWSFNPRNVEGDIFKAIEAHYKKLSERFGYKVIVPEATYNHAGYVYLNAVKDIDIAIKIFEKNVADHPNSANTYDSLAEALSVANRHPQALKAVNKALALTDKSDRRYELYTNRKKDILKKLTTAKAE